MTALQMLQAVDPRRSAVMLAVWPSLGSRALMAWIITCMEASWVVISGQQCHAGRHGVHVQGGLELVLDGVLPVTPGPSARVPARPGRYLRGTLTQSRLWIGHPVSRG